MAFYDEPFKTKDVLGWVSWDALDYGDFIYHACSAEESAEHLRTGVVPRKSKIAFKTTKLQEFNGIWVTLNHYSDGFDFGPIALRWRPEVLSGATFVVLRGADVDSHRWALVQAKPVGKELSREELFKIQPNGDAWHRTDPKNHVYNLVITQDLPASEADLLGVGERGGMSRKKAKDAAIGLATDYLNTWLASNGDLRRQIARFPALSPYRFVLTPGVEGPIPEPITIDFDDDTD